MCDREVWDRADKPSFLYFEIQEGKTYKQSFHDSYDKADERDRAKVRELPNFDADIFFDITSIDLRED